jgi:hypothetical protein
MYKTQKIYFQKNWTLSPTKWNFFLENLDSDLTALNVEMNDLLSPSGVFYTNISGFLEDADFLYDGYCEPSGAYCSGVYGSGIDFADVVENMYCE